MAAPVSAAVVTNASRTNLMDLSTLSWHEPYLQLFKAPAGIMPRIVSNAEVYGHVAEGPLQGVPIAGGGEEGQGVTGGTCRLGVSVLGR